MQYLSAQSQQSHHQRSHTEGNSAYFKNTASRPMQNMHIQTGRKQSIETSFEQNSSLLNSPQIKTSSQRPSIETPPKFTSERDLKLPQIGTQREGSGIRLRKKHQRHNNQQQNTVESDMNILNKWEEPTSSTRDLFLFQADMEMKRKKEQNLLSGFADNSNTQTSQHQGRGKIMEEQGNTSKSNFFTSDQPIVKHSRTRSHNNMLKKALLNKFEEKASPVKVELTDFQTQSDRCIQIPDSSKTNSRNELIKKISDMYLIHPSNKVETEPSEPYQMESPPRGHRKLTLAQKLFGSNNNNNNNSQNSTPSKVVLPENCKSDKLNMFFGSSKESQDVMSNNSSLLLQRMDKRNEKFLSSNVSQSQLTQENLDKIRMRRNQKLNSMGEQELRNIYNDREDSIISHNSGRSRGAESIKGCLKNSNNNSPVGSQNNSYTDITIRSNTKKKSVFFDNNVKVYDPKEKSETTVVTNDSKQYNSKNIKIRSKIHKELAV